VYKDTLYEYFEKFCEVRKLHVPSYGEFSETMYQEHGFKKETKGDTWKERNDLVC